MPQRRLRRRARNAILYRSTLMRDRASPEDLARLIAFLEELVPSLPPRMTDRSGEPLGDVVGHGLLQTIFLAVHDRARHLDREALTSRTTLEDLAYWMAPVLAEAAPDRSTRPPRGSYRTPSTTLRPVNENDIAWLYEAAMDPRLAHRWRFRGRTPAPEDFRSLVYTPNVLAQFMVVQADPPHDAIGHVSAYDADTVSRHCKAAFQRLPRRMTPPGSGGLMIEGFSAFIQYLFDHFDFNKLYLEVPEYNADIIPARDGALFRQEGELRDHYYYGDRMWSQLILAVYRDAWDEVAERFRGDWPADRARPLA